ncbi:hypothetical protein K501DRAFT_271649 [Backusella circina FSU 941]|nr:hypothetical protein K501DRAFT_271649 [Backusella circina FSU 941]
MSEVHSDREVESDLYGADTVMTEASSFLGDQPVMSVAFPETNLPKLPSAEVLIENEDKVLVQAPVQNQCFSEGRSGSDGFYFLPNSIQMVASASLYPEISRSLFFYF